MNRRSAGGTYLIWRALAPTRIAFIRPWVKRFAKRRTDGYIKRHTTIGLSLPDNEK